MKSFNKERLINNIYFLAKLKNIKIGDLENGIYVSTGYFSRYKKSSKDSSMSVDTLCLISNKLDVSLDILLFSNLSNLTASETQTFSYLSSFIKLTENKIFKWEKLTHNNIIENYENSSFLNKMDIPLLEYEKLEDKLLISYKSFYDDLKYEINFPLFVLEKETSTLYLTSINNKDNETIYEFYLYLDGEIKNIYRTSKYSNQELNQLLENLYNCCTKYSNEVNYDDETINEINNILNNLY
jgi:transcriptional regulator with XRE-family HTH domain